MPQNFAACAGAIGGFAGPYVVGALVDTKGGYVTCMQVLGGLFLVQAAMIICKPHHFSLAKELLQTALQGISGSLHAITGIPCSGAAGSNYMPTLELMHCLVLHILFSCRPSMLKTTSYFLS